MYLPNLFLCCKTCIIKHQKKCIRPRTSINFIYYLCNITNIIYNI